MALEMLSDAAWVPRYTHILQVFKHIKQFKWELKALKTNMFSLYF